MQTQINKNVKYFKNFSEARSHYTAQVGLQLGMPPYGQLSIPTHLQLGTPTYRPWAGIIDPAA